VAERKKKKSKLAGLGAGKDLTIGPGARVHRYLRTIGETPQGRGETQKTNVVPGKKGKIFWGKRGGRKGYNERQKVCLPRGVEKNHKPPPPTKQNPKNKPSGKVATLKQKASDKGGLPTGMSARKETAVDCGVEEKDRKKKKKEGWVHWGLMVRGQRSQRTTSKKGPTPEKRKEHEEGGPTPHLK